MNGLRLFRPTGVPNELRFVWMLATLALFPLCLSSPAFAQRAAAPMAEAAPPALGTRIPDSLSAGHEQQRCLTADAHYDPCASVTVGKVRYLVGWDQSSFQVVYLFTTDPAFRFGNQLAAGGRVRLMRAQLLPFKGWQIAPRLASAGWFPVVVPLDEPALVGEQDQTSALIVGFVQTSYLSERNLTR